MHVARVVGHEEVVHFAWLLEEHHLTYHATHHAVGEGCWMGGCQRNGEEKGKKEKEKEE
jgi:hypothetical protein